MFDDRDDAAPWRAPAAAAPPPVTVRWCRKPDLSAMSAIEAASFAEPWTPAELLQVLRGRGAAAKVAEGPGGGIEGYAVYLLMEDEVSLLNLAVAPDRRRRGVGAALVRDLAATTLRPARPLLTATVRESWLPALAFLRAAGFRASGLHRGFFGDDDGVVLGYRPRRAAAAGAS